MHAHSGGEHGITLRVRTRHSWRCARGGRVPRRFITNPRACQCGDLPPDVPLELDAPPDPPPPPPPTCPPTEVSNQGWELCAWKLDRKPQVPAQAQDLEGIVGLNVRSTTLSNAFRGLAAACLVLMLGPCTGAGSLRMLQSLLSTTARMQWYQGTDAEWTKKQCRSLSYINFHTRSRCQPIAHDYGLAGYKTLFAMRARSQFRVAKTVTAAVRIYSNDGFALSIHEVGTFSKDGEAFYEDYKVVAKLAHPQTTTCKAFTLAAETFEGGKIYVIDIKYYQTTGDKCLKVRAR